MKYIPKLVLNAELTFIVVLVLAIKASIVGGSLVTTAFLIDNFFTVLIIFSILDLYVVLKREYQSKFGK